MNGRLGGGLIVSILVGGAVGAATIVGVVNSVTGPPDESPANVEQSFENYGQ